ncbi:hypothetical protein BCV70DRAFT_121551 [Testicularia cyperi]|uniref:Uncharacterized protein n=1 Tax=Testicularia cyperi TaxID=1882483 RepID=A0A317XM96_9BASI|nr:hypothetical protein BCV70DRAFT_121551 [Testicularia cyperi]
MPHTWPSSSNNKDSNSQGRQTGAWRSCMKPGNHNLWLATLLNIGASAESPERLAVSQRNRLGSLEAGFFAFRAELGDGSQKRTAVGKPRRKKMDFLSGGGAQAERHARQATQQTSAIRRSGEVDTHMLLQSRVNRHRRPSLQEITLQSQFAVPPLRRNLPALLASSLPSTPCLIDFSHWLLIPLQRLRLTPRHIALCTTAIWAHAAHVRPR